MKFQTSDEMQNDFHEMAISSEYISQLEKMQITKPTQIQSLALPLGLKGADMIAIAQTGSGKTLVFVLTILMHFKNKPGSRALVLAPSREMAEQIHKVFLQLIADAPITSCLIMGGTPNDKQVSQLKKIPRLIVATPGRMKDHLTTNKLLLQKVEVVVIDEADRMLDMGFAPQLDYIRSTMRGQRQTLMFSASFNPNVEKVAKQFLGEQAYLLRAKMAESPVVELRQKVLFLQKPQKKDQLLIELRATKASVLVFAGSQKNCEVIEQHLSDNGFSSAVIHGGVVQARRQRLVREFREGKTRIMVTTDLLARGLDIPDLEEVINYDLPFEPEDFLHRIGRTARAGKKGKAVTFVTPADQRMYEKTKIYLKSAEEIKIDPDFRFSKKF